MLFLGARRCFSRRATRLLRRPFDKQPPFVSEPHVLSLDATPFPIRPLYIKHGSENQSTWQNLRFPLSPTSQSELTYVSRSALLSSSPRDRLISLVTDHTGGNLAIRKVAQCLANSLSMDFISVSYADLMQSFHQPPFQVASSGDAKNNTEEQPFGNILQDMLQSMKHQPASHDDNGNGFMVKVIDASPYVPSEKNERLAEKQQLKNDSLIHQHCYSLLKMIQDLGSKRTLILFEDIGGLPENNQRAFLKSIREILNKNVETDVENIVFIPETPAIGASASDGSVMAEMSLPFIRLLPPSGNKADYEKWKESMDAFLEQRKNYWNIYALRYLASTRNLELPSSINLDPFKSRIYSKNELKRLLSFAHGHSSSMALSDDDLSTAMSLLTSSRDLNNAYETISVASTQSASHQMKHKLQTDGHELSKYEQKFLPNIVTPCQTQTSFSDIACLEKTKETLNTLIGLPLKRPDLFQTGILRGSVSGVLLFGPPGTGKTMLAKAIAAESGANFLNVTPSSLFEMYVGEGEKNAKAMFTLARKLSPCVIFMDEVDAIFDSRDAVQRMTTKREILNEIMAEWDGLTSQNSGIIVVCATNRPFDLDDAVLRRLPRRILEERKKILDVMLASEKVDECVSLKELAEKTPLFSGSDLKNVCISAALQAVKEMARDNLQGPRVLTKNHFEEALKEVSSSVSDQQESLERLRRWNNIYGEGGKKANQRSFGF